MSNENLKEWMIDNRKLLFWSSLFLVLGWALYSIKEITSLLILAYGIALLIDPVVDRMERAGLSRGLSIIIICLGFIIGFITLMLFAVPVLIREYSVLITSLPSYLELGAVKLQELLGSWMGVDSTINLSTIITEAKELINALDVEQMKNLTAGIQSTVLSGYSFALTVFNLTFLPFFVYYIACDMDSFHRLVVKSLPSDIRGKVVDVCKEVMSHIYSFFKGQITVSCVMAVMYALGLTIIGLPSGLIVGAMAGLLNIVPYLGVAIGFILATLITLVNEFSWIQIAQVVGVFALVQALEGTVLTPRIVGKSVGLHPLGVMLALVIGAQLFGLLGLVLAIPAAASVRVLFGHAKVLVDSYDAPEELDAVKQDEETVA